MRHSHLRSTLPRCQAGGSSFFLFCPGLLSSVSLSCSPLFSQTRRILRSRTPKPETRLGRFATRKKLSKASSTLQQPLGPPLRRGGRLKTVVGRSDRPVESKLQGSANRCCEGFRLNLFGVTSARKKMQTLAHYHGLSRRRNGDVILDLGQ